MESNIEYSSKLMLTGVYVDKNRKDEDSDWPAFKKLLDDCRAGKIECVVIQDFRSIGASISQVEEVIRKFKEITGVRLISITDFYDSHGIDKSERIAEEKLVDKLLYGKKAPYRSIRAGSTFTTVPYGYKIVDGRYVIDPETVDTVREIFRWAADGNRVAEICRKLKEAKVSAPGELKGNEDASWSERTIKRMLTDESYIGTYTYGKRRKDGHKYITIPEEEQIRIRNHHEPIIDEDLYIRVQEKLTSRSRSVERTVEDIFSGTAYCASCGRQLTYLPAKGRVKTAKYFCRNHSGSSFNGIEFDHRPEITEAEIHSQVMSEVNGCIRKLAKAKDKLASVRALDTKGLDVKAEEYASKLSDLYAKKLDEESFQKEYEIIRNEYKYLDREHRINLLESNIASMMKTVIEDLSAESGLEPVQKLDADTVRDYVDRILLNPDGTLQINLKYTSVVDRVLK